MRPIYYNNNRPSFEINALMSFEIVCSSNVRFREPFAFVWAAQHQEELHKPHIWRQVPPPQHKQFCFCWFTLDCAHVGLCPHAEEICLKNLKSLHQPIMLKSLLHDVVRYSLWIVVWIYSHAFLQANLPIQQFSEASFCVKYLLSTGGYSNINPVMVRCFIVVFVHIPHLLTNVPHRGWNCVIKHISIFPLSHQQQKPRTIKDTSQNPQKDCNFPHTSSRSAIN